MRECDSCGQDIPTAYVETPVSEIIANPPAERTPFEMRYSIEEEPAYTEAEALLYAPQLTADLLRPAA